MKRAIVQWILTIFATVIVFPVFSAEATVPGEDLFYECKFTVGCQEGWSTEKGINPLDDTETVVVMTGQKAAYGKHVFLAVRCASGATDLMVNYPGAIDQKRCCVSRVGKQKAVKQEWKMSMDRKTIYFPGDSVAQIKQLMKNGPFVISAPGYSLGAQPLIFSTEDLAVAVTPVREACGW